MSTPSTPPILDSVRVSAPPSLAPAPLDMGDVPGTPGAITVADRCLLRDGVPWIPVMGEYHFSRDLPERWERELRKMRAGGVDVVATYLLWILHEETQGDVRWDGARDVRAFVEAAHRVGLSVILRIGPWAHGETRNGGFPDWLQALDIAHRTDDPAYLAHARRWIAAIADQTRDLIRGPERPDAPVIGIQVDNELYDQPQHLATLRALAEEAGLHPALWTATGWGGAQLPARVVFPVYAGYSDGFWEEHDVEWPAFGPMHFMFTERRDDASVGADLRDDAFEQRDDDLGGAGDPWPYATCELGGGMTVAYHRRPHVDPEDVTALALAKLGSGSAWQGYYLYHGSTHVMGEHSTTQESHATAYPNDVPVRDYDFFAPLGAHGQQRPHFHALRRQHLMLQSWGERLAPLPATIPPQRTGGPRWSVRGDGCTGFLFLANYQPAVAALPPVDDAQVEVAFEDRIVVVPSEPVQLPSGTSVMWPLRQPFGSIEALTATAQPVTQLEVGGRTVVLFAATPGVEVELQLEVDGERETVRPDRAPGPDCVVTVGDTDLVFLTRAQADTVWRGEVDGRDTLVLWDGEGWFDGAFTVVAPARPAALLALPPLAQEPAGQVGPFTRHEVPAGPASFEVTLDGHPEPRVAPVRRDTRSGRASAPTDGDFAELAAHALHVDDEWFDGVEQLLLTLDWTGDALRLETGDTLIADQFWSGRTLEVDLVPWREAIRTHGLQLRAFAWNPAAPVYVDRRVRPAGDTPVLDIRAVTARPVVTVPLA